MFVCAHKYTGQAGFSKRQGLFAQAMVLNRTGIPGNYQARLFFC